MMSKFKLKVLPVALGFVALAGASVSANAALTVVTALGQGTGNERCLEGASCAAVGSYGLAPSLQKVFENDIGGTLVRVNDTFGDALWANVSLNSGRVDVTARYAGDTSSLGITTGLSGFTSLGLPAPLTSKVYVNNVAAAQAADVAHAGDYLAASSSPATIFAGGGQPFAFVLKDGATQWSSNNSATGPGSVGYGNSTGAPSVLERGLDHMVTFQVYIGGIAQQDYFIAFEDRSKLTGSDRDFNDYVAEVKYVNAIPEPETYAMLLAGLGLMGFVARRRQRNAAA